MNNFNALMSCLKWIVIFLIIWAVHCFGHSQDFYKGFDAGFALVIVVSCVFHFISPIIKWSITKDKEPPSSPP